MSKKSFARLARIVSETFGTGKDDGFSLVASLTRFEKFVHFWVLVYRSFVRNRCPVRASALSYTTLLALIPMLAVVMSITNVILKSEGEVRIKQFIEEFVEKMIPTASVLESAGEARPDETEGPALSKPTANAVAENAQDLTATFSNRLAQIQFDTNAFMTAIASSNSIAPPSTNRATANTVAGVKEVKQNVAREAASLIYQFAHKSYSGTLGVTGMIFLILTAILTLTRVEETFNDIWGVTRGRDWWSRITTYFFAIALGPPLIIAAIGLANSPNMQKTRELITFVPFIEPLLSTYLPLIIICFTFALLYKLVPNTKVDFSAALVGGSLAGISWHFYNKLTVLLASSAANANAFYGRLVIIPLFMGGLYVVWLMVLFGSQVAYAFQNRASYLQEKLAEHVNQRGREFVALRLMTCIGQRFHGGLPPPTVPAMSQELGIPSKLIQQVLQTLLAARLVVEVSGTDAAYAPARPLETINCHHILLAMRATQGQELVTRDEPVRVEVLGEFARIQAAEKAAASTVTMLALVNRAQARLELVASTSPEIEITPAPEVAAMEPLVELPGEKPPGEALPEVEVIEPIAPAPIKISKPVSPANISSAAPLAASNTHDNESFPL